MSKIGVPAGCILLGLCAVWCMYTCLLPHNSCTICDSPVSDCVNVLLVGCGDLRHVLKTMALASRHTSKPVHVCLVHVALPCSEMRVLYVVV